MKPRPARAAARPAISAVRTVESGAGRLTVVTHPVGASSPLLTEPPEAGFIMEAAATLGELQVRHQPPVNPRPLQPFIPSSDLPMGDALLALEAMLAGIRPQPRPARKLTPASHHGFAQSRVAPPTFELPALEPVWFASLGLSFKVAGIDNGSTSVSTGLPAVPSVIAAAPSAAVPLVVHRAIPARRPARPLSASAALELGMDRLLQPPVVSAPRLRIHLPKPTLNPLRPRYAFAPKPAEQKARPDDEKIPIAIEKAAAVEEPVEKTAEKFVEKPADSHRQKGAHGQNGRKKQRGAKNGRAGVDLNHLDEPATALVPAPDAGPVVEIKKPEPKLELRPLQPTGKVERVQKEGQAEKGSSEKFKVPSFGGKSDPEPEGFWSRIPGWQKAAAALVIIGIAVGAWAVPAFSRVNARSTALPSLAAPAPTNMGADSWETGPTGDTSGVARRRVVSQYRPARAKRDYILEFTGQIEQRAMGWVFRMKDSRNYYCLKLEKNGDGPAATVRLVKFAVVNGEEQAHKLVELGDPIRSGPPIKIRLDVRGQNFSTQVNGKHIDVWIDNQLSSGTVGFSNESGERAVIRTVKVSY